MHGQNHIKIIFQFQYTNLKIRNAIYFEGIKILSLLGPPFKFYVRAQQVCTVKTYAVLFMDSLFQGVLVEFLNVITDKKYLLLFFTCYFVTNGISLHPKLYCIFALVHSISRVILYFCEVYESGWNIAIRFGSRFHSQLQFLVSATHILVTYVKKYKCCQ